ncbi:hypothetical protein SAMN02744778_01650 [Pantoea sp. GL120224-02]|nr:hypothetical protein SAMN02744778_01650 [Pantoea sp. GL120224-02]
MNTRNVELRVQVEDVRAFNLRVFEEDCLRVETKNPAPAAKQFIALCCSRI